ncbi:hypothetical protein CYY_002319 [Polysphondylium violaceum]|uniref:Uncharacterized protein n=1 Tax=Polysphondylium violaceum TaxID=133409 RepID=A0A8J4Q1G0_9MYCE|nr:hypothetical protein CYY_002319 [Polysphondylium violaceum]
MNQLFVCSISPKKQKAELIIRHANTKFDHKEIHDIVHWLRDVFQVRGKERVTRELKGFLNHTQPNSYIKFEIRLDHDFSVIQGGGLLGYISDQMYDAYDTWAFVNVEVFPSQKAMNPDQLKNLWNHPVENVVPVLEYIKNPSALQHPPKKAYSFAYHPKSPISLSPTNSFLSTSPSGKPNYKPKVSKEILSSPPINSIRA